MVTRLGLRGEAFPTVLAGGLFKVLPWLEAAVRTRMAEVAPRSVVSPLTVEPAMGAVRLALAELHGGAVIPVYAVPKEKA